MVLNCNWSTEKKKTHTRKVYWIDIQNLDVEQILIETREYVNRSP